MDTWLDIIKQLTKNGNLEQQLNTLRDELQQSMELFINQPSEQVTYEDDIVAPPEVNLISAQEAREQAMQKQNEITAVNERKINDLKNSMLDDIMKSIKKAIEKGQCSCTTGITYRNIDRKLVQDAIYTVKDSLKKSGYNVSYWLDNISRSIELRINVTWDK